MTVLFSNNATSSLVADLVAEQTTLVVKSADAYLFPSPSGGHWNALTLISPNGAYEIVHCVGRVDAVFTVLRGQEGTLARPFAAGDKVSHRATAGSLDALKNRPYVGAEPPDVASPGDLWWETDSGKLFIYYDDGDSTQWVEVGDTGTGTVEYAFFVGGRPAAGEFLFRYMVTAPFCLLENLEGSLGSAVTAAAAAVTWSLRKNNAQFATVTWAAGGTVPTLTAAPTCFDVGDRLSVISGSSDASLADISLSLVGILGAGVETTPPVPPYAAPAVHFDGSTKLLQFSNFTGQVNSPVGTYFAWMKIAAGSGTVYPLKGNSSSIAVSRAAPLTTPTVTLVGSGHSCSYRVNGSSPLVDGNWHLFATSWDTNHGTGAKVFQIAIDRILYPVTLVTDTGTDVAWPVTWSTDPLAVGAIDGIQYDMSDWYLNIATAVDLSNLLNLNKIIDTAGNPVSQGPVGALLTGNVPLIFLSGNDTLSYRANDAGTGSFAADGTLTTASTSPSD